MFFIKKLLTSGNEIKTESFRVGFGIVNSGFGVQVEDEDYTPVDVDINGNIMRVKMISEETVVTLRTWGIVMLFASVAMIMTLITIHFVGGLCKAFRNCTTPFEENVIKKMQNLAIALIPWTIVSSITESIENSFAKGGVSITLSVDMGIVLLVLIVLVLVYVFKYGAILQQESDETL